MATSRSTATSPSKKARAQQNGADGSPDILIPTSTPPTPGSTKQSKGDRRDAKTPGKDLKRGMGLMDDGREGAGVDGVDKEKTRLSIGSRADLDPEFVRSASLELLSRGVIGLTGTAPELVRNLRPISALSRSTSSLASGIEQIGRMPNRRVRSTGSIRPSSGLEPIPSFALDRTSQNASESNVWDSEEDILYSDAKTLTPPTPPFTSEDRALMDQALFPGYRFTPSPPPTEGFRFATDDELYPQAASLQNPWDDAVRMLANMGAEKRVDYERFVLRKYWRDGGFTMFKGKEEMKQLKAKFGARKEVAKVERAVMEKEKECRRLEQEIIAARAAFAKSSKHIPRLEEEITRFAQETRTWELEKRLPSFTYPSPARSPENNRSSSPPHQKFTLPADPVLNLFPRYKDLVKEYSRHQQIVAETSSLIPRLEEAIVQVQHDYLAMMLQQDQLRPIDEQIHESDVNDAAEKLVVDKWTHILEERKLKRRKLDEEKRQRDQFAMATEAKLKEEQRMQKAVEARRKCHARLRETIADIRSRRQSKTEEKRVKREKRQAALKELMKEIVRIRQANTQTVSQNKEVIKGDESNDPIQRIRNMMQQRYSRAEKEKERLMEEMETRSMEILGRLIAEEDRRQNQERKEKMVKEQHKIMEDGWNAPEIGTRIVVKKKEKRPRVQKKVQASKVVVDTTGEKSANGSSVDREPETNPRSAPPTLRPSVETRETLPLSGPGDDVAMSISLLAASEKPKRQPLPPPRHAIPSRRALTDGGHRPTSIPTTAPFSATPPSAIFTDYDPDQESYTATITLTNTSCRTNALKMFPTDLSLTDLFDVKWGPNGPPGRMSAGRTCEVVVTFRPRGDVEGDLEGVVKFVVEHGRTFEFPIGCRKKRCLPVVVGVSGTGGEMVQFPADDNGDTSSPPTKHHGNIVAELLDSRKIRVNFGNCMIGGKVVRRIHLANKGAITTGLQIVDMDNDENMLAGSSSSFHILASADDSAYQLNSYSSCTISVAFTPSPQCEDATLNKQKATYAVKFDEELMLDPMVLECTGTVDIPPVSIDRTVMDLGMCIAGQSYRDHVVLRNSARAAIRVHVAAGDFTGDNSMSIVNRTGDADVRPDALSLTIPTIGQLEISPQVAFLQPHGEPFHLHIKATPSRDAHQRLKQENNDGFTVPLRLQYSKEGITFHIDVTLQGRITTTDIEFSLPTEHANDSSKGHHANFGTCSIYDRPQTVPLRITNHSHFPQAIKFVSSHPRNLSLSDKGTKGEIQLQPTHTTTYNLRFTPLQEDLDMGKSYDDMSLILTRLTYESGKEIVIKCSGKAICPPLRFDREYGVVELKPTAFGSVMHENISIARQWTCEEERRRKKREIRRRARNKRTKSLPENGSTRESEESPIKFAFGRPVIVEAYTNAEWEAREKGTLESLQPELRAVPDFLINADALPVKILPINGRLRPGEKADIQLTLAPPIPPPKEEEKKDTSPQATDVGPDSIVRDRVPTASTKLEDPISTVPPARGPAGKDREKPRNGGKDKQRSRNATASTMALADAGPPAPVVEELKQPAEPILPPKSDFERRLESVQECKLVFRIPCRMRRITKSKLREESSAIPDQPSSNNTIDNLSSDPTTITYLHVTCPIVKPDIVPIDLSAGQSILNFEQVPVGQRAVKPIKVKNLSDSTIVLGGMFANDSSKNCFHLADENLPAVPPGGEVAVNIAFEPKEEDIISRSEYTLTSKTAQLRVQLVGEGIVPKIKIEEPNERDIFFGDLCLGSVATNTVRVRNVGSHSVRCGFEVSKTDMGRNSLRPAFGTLNTNGSNPFSVVPVEAVIGPDSEQEVTISFAPDRESDHFFDYFKIKAWGIPEDDLKIKVHGRCWDTTTAVLGYDPPPETLLEGPFDIPPELFVSRHDIPTARSSLSEFSKVSDEQQAEREEEEEEEEEEDIYAMSGPRAPAPTPVEPTDEPPSLAQDLESMRPMEMEQLRYAMLKCVWRQVDGGWEIEPKDLTIANLKPSPPSTPEGAAAPEKESKSKKKEKPKRTPSVPADFVIDPYEMDFEYHEELGVFLPMEKEDEDEYSTSANGETPAERFRFIIEPSEGTVDQGHMRVLRIGVERMSERRKGNSSMTSSMMSDLSSRSHLAAPMSAAKQRGKSGRKKAADADAVEAQAEVPRPNPRAAKPVNLERCFRITLNGGLKLMDAETAVPATENRVWIVKVIAECPPVE